MKREDYIPLIKGLVVTVPLTILILIFKLDAVKWILGTMIFVLMTILIGLMLDEFL